jgi:hypothetical protein
MVMRIRNLLLIDIMQSFTRNTFPEEVIFFGILSFRSACRETFADDDEQRLSL